MQGAIAFPAWLGVHEALLTSTRAKIEAVMEWAWDYFGGARGDAVLDRGEEMQINWNEDAESQWSELQQRATGRWFRSRNQRLAGDRLHVICSISLTFFGVLSFTAR
jgi:hypothetical protein